MSQIFHTLRKLHGDGLRKIDPPSLPSLEQEIWDVFAKRNKQLSQLIAQKWLDGTELTVEDIKNLFKDQNLDVIIDKKPYTEWQSQESHPAQPPTHNYEGYWTIPDDLGNEPIGLYIPYPERPPEECLSSEVLQEWIDQDSSAEPFYPHHNSWIPYSC